MKKLHRSALVVVSLSVVIILGSSQYTMAAAAEDTSSSPSQSSPTTAAGPQGGRVAPQPTALDIQKIEAAAEVELGSPKVKVNLGSAPVIGPYLTPVTVVVWSDFESAKASQLAQVLLRVGAVYMGKVRIFWKNLPQPGNSRDMAAAEAAMSAHEQGLSLFWRMHDQLLVNQNRLGPQLYDKVANDINLDMDRFHNSIAEHKNLSIIQADIAEAKSIGVKSGPVSFVNGHKLVGVQPFAAFQRVIEAELAAAEPKS